nr:hypothetical protein GCM10025730_07700 [Promicromonospora thailandica]
MTSLLRTVVDCALTLHPLEALVVVDSALRLGADRDDLLAMLQARTGRRGVRRAVRVVTLGDAGAQSAWETWVRYEMLRAGLPRPVTQMAVRTDHGIFHTDLGYPRWALGIEFDGQVKYRPDGVRPGHDPAQEYMREKARDAAIRRAGVTLEHVSAKDRRDAQALVARLGRHLPRRPARALTPSSHPWSDPSPLPAVEVGLLWRGRHRPGPISPQRADLDGVTTDQAEKHVRAAGRACHARRTVIETALQAALADRPALGASPRTVRSVSADRKEAVMDDVVRAAALSAADATVTRSTRR